MQVQKHSKQEKKCTEKTEIEEQPESDASSFISISLRGVQFPSHRRMQGGFAPLLGCLAHLKNMKSSYI